MSSPSELVVSALAVSAAAASVLVVSAAVVSELADESEDVLVDELELPQPVTIAIAIDAHKMALITFFFMIILLVFSGD
jgi:archaellum biogenesis protein FlaJ (TadC family)